MDVVYEKSAGQIPTSAQNGKVINYRFQVTDYPCKAQRLI
jgi:hypothetical protein